MTPSPSKPGVICPNKANLWSWIVWSDIHNPRRNYDTLRYNYNL
jgi:hypothetical protein